MKHFRCPLLGIIAVSSLLVSRHTAQAQDEPAPKILKIQWSQDAHTWKDLGKDNTVTAIEGETVSFRAVPEGDDAEWPGLSPTWIDHGHQDYKNFGPQVTIGADRANTKMGEAGEFTVDAVAGDTKTIKVRVLPSYEITLSEDEDYDGEDGVPGALINAIVTDFLGHPYPNMKVHFATTSGWINQENVDDDDVTCKANGRAKVKVFNRGKGIVTVTATLPDALSPAVCEPLKLKF